MRVAVYCIAKDETKFVERCLSSCLDADEIVVCDTGSTDDTLVLINDFAKQHQQETTIHSHQLLVDPWRFDAARNAALALVSPDIDVCIPLDLDEVLVAGWRENLEKAWVQGTTRLRYEFVWSWEKEGIPGLSFQQDKIHARRGYLWKGLVHEVITPDPRTKEQLADTNARLLEHHPDDSKSRGQYLELLRLAVNENTQDDRMMHYYGRELMYAGRNGDAISILLRHLDLPSARWEPERAASMRYIALCYQREGAVDTAVKWARRACAECPDTREPWVLLAQLLHARGDWPECYAAATRALSVKHRGNTYINEAEVWGSLPHDLAAVAAFNLGLEEEALEHAEEALKTTPGDERLLGNVKMIQDLIQTKQADAVQG